MDQGLNVSFEGRRLRAMLSKEREGYAAGSGKEDRGSVLTFTKSSRADIQRELRCSLVGLSHSF